MELLIRVAETGSMTHAAQQLNLTPAAVSATVQRIERSIGLRLFERTTRSLHPTEEGLVLIEGCQRVVDTWRKTLEEAQGQRAEIEGAIHLSAPADTTYQILSDLILTLHGAHPKLKVILNTSDALQHLQRDALDMAIRYGPLKDSTLKARKLAEGVQVLVAAPSYLATHGTPEALGDLQTHTCLTLHRGNVPTRRWTLLKGGKPHTIPIESPLCGNGYLARAWALKGMGVAYKSLFDVIDDLEAGALVHVLPAYRGPEQGIYALFPSRRFLPTRVRVVDAAITAHFKARWERCEAWLEEVS